MNTNKFCVELHNTTSNDYRTHFFVPKIELELEYNRGNELLGTCDTTTFYDKSTGDAIITVSSNLNDVSTWDKWESTRFLNIHQSTESSRQSLMESSLLEKILVKNTAKDILVTGSRVMN